MSLPENYIQNFFPLPTIRPGQLDSINRVMEAFTAKKKFFVLEGATGTGKSAIGFTLAQMIFPAYYLAPQKILQDQLIADFGQQGKHLGKLVPMIDLKGRNAYECLYYKEFQNAGAHTYANSAEEAHCTKQGYSFLEKCKDICHYAKRKQELLTAQIGLLNFHSFIYQTTFAKFLPKRPLLIIDEAHNLESALMGVVTVLLRSTYYYDLLGVTLPKLATPQEYQAFFKSTGAVIRLEAAIKKGRELGDNPEKLERMSQLHFQLATFEKSDLAGWVVETSEGLSRKRGPYVDVKLQPVTVGPFAEEFIFKYADHVLLCSGTILDLKSFLRGLDVSLDYKSQFSQVTMTFPVKNRRVICDYAFPTAFTYKNKEQSWPFMVKKVEEICAKHEGQRGIIHAHTHAIARYIYERASPKLRKRLLYQGERESELPQIENGLDFEGDREELLRVHEGRTDSIILGPAFHEGIDLKDDLGRFQILTKVPWPNLTAPQLIHRDMLHPGYSDWLTAIKLVQSLGRVVRHESDWGWSYVIDRGFESFVANHKALLPAALHEALQYEKTVG
jgi:ATP-dependent DNA helicase DinG